jgi:hypothetical protein
MRSAAGVIGFPGSASSPPFPTGPAASTVRRSAATCAATSSPCELGSPSESSVSSPPPMSPPTAPSLGFAVPPGDFTSWRPCDGPPSSRRLSVLGVSHALDGFRRLPAGGSISPHCHLQGSPFRGLFLARSRAASSATSLPSRRWRRSAAGFYTGATSCRLALRALFRDANPSSTRWRLAHAPTRSPPGFPSSRCSVSPTVRGLHPGRRP